MNKRVNFEAEQILDETDENVSPRRDKEGQPDGENCSRESGGQGSVHAMSQHSDNEAG